MCYSDCESPEESEEEEAPTQRRQGRERAPPQPVQSWMTEADADVAPVPKRFLPARPPGHQLNPADTHSPLDLFKLYFNTDTVRTICQNTNKQAAKSISNGKKYTWIDITIQELYKFMGLILFMALIKLDDIRSYWRQSNIFSVPFPATVMTRDRFRVISWNIHMSDPDEDVVNDRKKGTQDHDRLFRLRPLLDVITSVCKAFYHPRRNLSIDERMVARKSNTGMTQYMKAKPTKWGFKLFVLADSSNGYTVDFSVYTGKTQFPSGTGLAYDSVMSLIKPAYLGTGYNLYVDNFYSSPRLFRDLYAINISATGTYRENRRDCPRTCVNGLSKKDARGAIRWIRDGPLVFVKWMDTREVSVCSTVHPAYSGNTVERRVRSQDKSWSKKSIPCPTPVAEYNRHMGGVDLSDQLIQYYSVHQKGMKWYRTLLYHFIDIAATNSYLLHKELCQERQETPLTHRAFQEQLTAQLCGVTVELPPHQAEHGHVPVPISRQEDPSKKASKGRRNCELCKTTQQKYQSTPWQCKECKVALCLIVDRNCFEMWHS